MRHALSLALDNEIVERQEDGQVSCHTQVQKPERFVGERLDILAPLEVPGSGFDTSPHGEVGDNLFSSLVSVVLYNLEYSIHRDVSTWHGGSEHY